LGADESARGSCETGQKNFCPQKKMLVEIKSKNTYFPYLKRSGNFFVKKLNDGILGVLEGTFHEFGNEM